MLPAQRKPGRQPSFFHTLHAMLDYPVIQQLLRISFVN